MGIQKIAQYQNDYKQADPQALDIAGRLVKIEEDFMGEMKAFL